MATKAQQQPTTQPAPRQAVTGKAPGRVLQRSAVSADLAGVEAPSIVRDVLRSPGQPLDDATRAYMEPRFGHDFSHVRVHTDNQAAESARAVHANAWTVGNHIAFDAGKYRPTAAPGTNLLAHELTHTLQQTGRYDNPGITQLATLRIQNPSDAAEAEARGTSSRIVQTATAGIVAQTTTQSIAREPTGSSTQAPVQRRTYQVTETELPDGTIKIRVWGKVGDPIKRPGLEKKYPLPKDVGLPGYDRWHLAGPNAIGAEEGIMYAPKKFNISQTAEVENIVRKARLAVREQGGDVFFDFEATGRIKGDHDGVRIVVLEKVTWKASVRAAGGDKIVSILNRTESLAAPTRRTRTKPKKNQGSGKATADPDAPPTKPKPKPKPSPKAPKATAPKPKVKAPKGISSTRPPRASSLGRGRGMGGAGAAAAGAIVTLALSIAANHYLQGEMDKKNQEAFQKKLEAQQSDIEKMVAGQEAAAQELEKAGRPIFVNVSLYVRYQTDVSGELGGLTVLMDLKVRKVTVSEKKLEHVTESQIKQGFAEYAVKDALGISESHLDFSLSYPDLEMVSLPDPAALPPPNCFIATACYGSPLAPEVQFLRQFRDEWLQYQPGGKTFIHIYYSVSPPIADKLRHHQQARTIVRRSVVAPVLKVVQDHYVHWHAQHLPGSSSRGEGEVRS